jgi:hypothetical protein
MVEYVTVTFPKTRQVLIDGQHSGVTNQILQVQTGTHVFALAGAQNFAPASQRVAVVNTSSIIPLEVPFEKDS